MHSATNLPIEPLEYRIAPATLVNPTTITYQDADGDDVVVKFSKPILATDNPNTVFTFDVGGFSGSNQDPQQLQQINLNGLLNPAEAAGVSITVTAKRNPTRGGDGFAAVGYIQAINLPLGKVVIDGDLGAIEAGVGTNGLQSLTVASLGAHGTATQGPVITSQSTITGSVGSILVQGDIHKATLLLFGGQDVVVKSITVGGSIIGGPDSFSGSINAGSSIGTIKVGGSLQGGSGADSGEIVTTGKIGSIMIGGSVFGALDATPDVAGSIHATGGLGTVIIKGDLVGRGPDTGKITSGSTIGSIKIGGSIVGGEGVRSGGIETGLSVPDGSVGSVQIGGSIEGNTGTDSAKLILRGAVKSLLVKGSILSASANYNTSENASTQIVIQGSAGPIKIGGNLQGGSGFGSGSILMTGALKSLTVGGTIRAGSSVSTGCVFGQNIGPIKVGNVEAMVSSGDRKAEINALSIASVTVSGSFIGGLIDVEDWIGPIKIKGDLTGGRNGPATINAEGTDAKKNVAIASLTVGSKVENVRIYAGYSAPGIGNAINPDAQVGPVKVGGMWIASSLTAGVQDTDLDGFGDADDVKIQGTDDPAVVSRIASITIGRVAVGTSVAGDHYGFTAQHIGSLKIAGTSFKLQVGGGNDTSATDPLLNIGSTDDFRVREVPL